MDRAQAGSGSSGTPVLRQNSATTSWRRSSDIEDMDTSFLLVRISSATLIHVIESVSGLFRLGLRTTGWGISGLTETGFTVTFFPPLFGGFRLCEADQ
jgi:hypothetical protein